MGLDLSFFSDFFGGGGAARDVPVSGAFGNLNKVGEALSRLMLENISTPAAESERYRLGSRAIEQSLARRSRTARQQLGDTAVARGFSDSGAVLRGSGEIARGEQEALGSALQNFLLQLEMSRATGALDFITAGSQEYLGARGMSLDAAIAERGQNIGFIESIGDNIADITSSFLSKP